MSSEHIVALLIQERDRFNKAIEALQGTSERRGRPQKNPLTPVPAPTNKAPRKRKPFSAAARRKMALAQKKRWAAQKKPE